MISVLHLAAESTNYFVNIKLNRNIVGYTRPACKQGYGQEQMKISRNTSKVTGNGSI